MAATSDTDQETPPLWQWVSVADYHPPKASVKAVSENWFTTLRGRLRSDAADAESSASINHLEALSHGQLARIAPDPGWGGAVVALDGALGDWLANAQPERLTAFLIAPPHGGSAEILRLWAEQRQWRVLDPPAPEQILAGDSQWLSSQQLAEQPWVLPALERVYLRHAAGLGLMRQFLHQAYSGKLGRGIIGCDSWAWAFLRRVSPPGGRAKKLTVQAFDKERLTRCFQALAEGSDSQPLLFRQANNGKYILPPPAGTVDTPVSHSDFLQHLAAYSRGIPGIAWAIWRASLRARPAADTAAGKTSAADRNSPHPTLWITPWDHLNQPELSTHVGRSHAFVLHALLLHNGLATEWLARLLPLSLDQVLEALALLQDANVLEQTGEIWRVAPRGYPVIRKFLENEHYLIDDF
ncbi:MAG: hypothetical protein U5O69_05880 [Candidatus Competibacteraceae bacterium]|nr:hypothetical protein [Candidatus Competibacteraceae bacterium]